MGVTDRLVRFGGAAWEISLAFELDERPRHAVGLRLWYEMESAPGVVRLIEPIGTYWYRTEGGALADAYSAAQAMWLPLVPYHAGSRGERSYDPDDDPELIDRDKATGSE